MEAPPTTANDEARLIERDGFAADPQRRGKARLLLMGLRRSGKSSISSVLLHKTLPSATLYIESTTQLTKDSMRSFMDFEIWEVPAHVSYSSVADLDADLSEFGSVIWVIDAQDEYFDAIERLNATILELQSTYPQVNIEVFVHKVDGLSDDFKGDIYRDIQQRVLDEMADCGYDNVPVNFYQTSIYDHSIYETFSKIIQKLVPQHWALENLLNTLCSNCRISKAYLFDVMSKVYIASDTSPADIGTYETCSDYIDMVVDISEIYGWSRPSDDPSNNVAKAEGIVSPDAESVIVMERRGIGYLYLREINRYLALICVMQDDDPTENKAIVDFNVNVFQKAVNDIFRR